MKIAVIGLGSMGKRRVRDLLRLNCEIVGFDISEKRARETQEIYNIKFLPSFEKILDEKVQAVVISTPPDIHFEYYKKCFKNKISFFSEANIFCPNETWFLEQEKSSGVRAFPSATWRSHPIFHMSKEILERNGMEKVNSVHYHYGGYLPLWHPYENYWDFYAGKRKTSAAREMVPWELEWLCFVFGKVESVHAIHGQFSKWKTDIDDSYFLHLKFESGLKGTLNIELHQTAPFRIGRISCQNLALTLDLAKHEIQRYDLETDSWKFLKMPGTKTLNSFNFEEIYFREMENFHSALLGKNLYNKTWQEERHLSDILFAAEESSKCGSWIKIDDIKNSYDGQNW
ncbi:MAG: Gfo/Idh/MocA family oxidoreductase [Candidatus Riflebacteria bacterium]|nr:Gfo/Idh/MocA family oxidoreductase [Candidatus Riflebacteria bacterium]